MSVFFCLQLYSDGDVGSYFFFSSRRRHTRCGRDWSSDVCSSDLQPPEDWDEVMRANVRGSWLVCRAAGAQMISQGDGGKVVLVSSTRGRLGHPAGYSAYCPSKAAVDLLCKTLACEWGAHRITVNAIAPTVFRSELTAWMYAEEGRGRQTREAMLARIPLGRLGEPEDFVGALIYLLSPASDFCTGHVLYVDGGYTAG